MVGKNENISKLPNNDSRVVSGGLGIDIANLQPWPALLYAHEKC
jgi:hypothetical protein